MSDKRSELLERLAHLKAQVDDQRRVRSMMNQLAEFEPYPKQKEFYLAGLTDRERLLMAANQVGKTFSGSREVAYHVTGLYPEWWPGHRFNHAISCWCGSETAQVTRDTCQLNLIGPPEDREAWGSGAIPQHLILDTAMASGNVPNTIETVTVKHVSGGTSVIGFKNYEQGRRKWQGTKKHLIWLDEEPPMDIYTEALTRTNAVADGRMMITFTPLLGMSEVVMSFFEAERAEQEQGKPVEFKAPPTPENL